MRHLIIIEATASEITWVPEYMHSVPAVAAQYGGFYITRSSLVELLEGDDRLAHYVLVLEFPSYKTAMAFYNSEEYAPYKAMRLRGAECKLSVVAVEKSTEAPSDSTT